MTTIRSRTEPLDGVRAGEAPESAGSRPAGPTGATAPRRVTATRTRRDRASRLRDEMLDYIRPAGAGELHPGALGQVEALAELVDQLQAEAPEDRLARWGSAVLLQELRKQDLLRSRLNDLIGG
jgi:hypothetical protein